MNSIYASGCVIWHLGRIYLSHKQTAVYSVAFVSYKKFSHHCWTANWFLVIKRASSNSVKSKY